MTIKRIAPRWRTTLLKQYLYQKECSHASCQNSSRPMSHSASPNGGSTYQSLFTNLESNSSLLEQDLNLIQLLSPQLVGPSVKLSYCQQEPSGKLGLSHLSLSILPLDVRLLYTEPQQSFQDSPLFQKEISTNIHKKF